MTLKGVAEIVGECSDGADALAAYERLRPDWVLMDIGMLKSSMTLKVRNLLPFHRASLIKSADQT